MSSPADPMHRALEAWIDAHHERQVAFLREIVAVPTDMPPGDNAPAAERAAGLLAGLGFEVERDPVPPEALAGYGMKSLTNLVVRQRFGAGGGPTVALNAHGDVVPPGDGWTRPPYGGVVEDGVMYGRGVAVSKSDIATYAFALAALREVAGAGAGPGTGAGAGAGGTRLSGTVELHFTYDEEFGGRFGPARLLELGLSRPDLAISAGFSYSVVTAHDGCLQLEVVVRGRSAHAAMPETGRDALRAALAIIDALYREGARLATLRSSVPGIAQPTLVVGTIAGGTNTNVVPDRVAFRLDRRMIPEEDPEQVEHGLRALIEAEAAGHDGIRVAIDRLLLARALRPLPGHERLLAPLARHATRLFGTPVGAAGVPLYTDARHYGEAGVPAVLYGAGPRSIVEANAKRPDENLRLDDLRRATQVVACALVDLLAR